MTQSNLSRSLMVLCAAIALANCGGGGSSGSTRTPAAQEAESVTSGVVEPVSEETEAEAEEPAEPGAPAETVAVDVVGSWSLLATPDCEVKLAFDADGNFAELHDTGARYTGTYTTEDFGNGVTAVTATSNYSTGAEDCGGQVRMESTSTWYASMVDGSVQVYLDQALQTLVGTLNSIDAWAVPVVQESDIESSIDSEYQPTAQQCEALKDDPEGAFTLNDLLVALTGGQNGAAIAAIIAKCDSFNP